MNLEIEIGEFASLSEQRAALKPERVQFAQLKGQQQQNEAQQLPKEQVAFEAKKLQFAQPRETEPRQFSEERRAFEQEKAEFTEQRAHFEDEQSPAGHDHGQCKDRLVQKSHLKEEMARFEQEKQAFAKQQAEVVQRTAEQGRRDAVASCAQLQNENLYLKRQLGELQRLLGVPPPAIAPSRAPIAEEEQEYELSPLGETSDDTVSSPVSGRRAIDENAPLVMHIQRLH